MEGIEELKSWIRSFSKSEGRKPQAADMPGDIRCIYTIWQGQKASASISPPNLIVEPERALGAPPRQVQPAVVNPFARAAKKAKLDLLPKGAENMPPVSARRELGMRVSCGESDLMVDSKGSAADPASSLSPTLTLRTKQFTKQAGCSFSRLAPRFSVKASDGDEGDGSHVQQDSFKLWPTNAWQDCDNLPLPQASRIEESAHVPSLEPTGAGRAGGEATRSRPASQAIHGRAADLKGVTQLPCTAQLAAGEDSSALRTLKRVDICSADLPTAKESRSALHQLGRRAGWEEARVTGAGNDLWAGVDADAARSTSDGEAERCGQAGKGAREAGSIARHSSRVMRPPNAAHASSRRFLQDLAKRKSKAKRRPTIEESSTTEESDSEQEEPAKSRTSARKPQTRALKSRQSGSLEGGDDDGMQDPSGLNLTKTEAGENAQVNRPAARKTGKAAAAAGARQPGQRSTTSKKGSGGGSAASGVAQKPRQNFVRMDKKGGRGRFGYKSKAGMKRGAGGKGKFKKFAPKFLPQAGDGADIVEGWEAKRGRCCFKCGKPGHFASACPGLTAPPSQVRPVEVDRNGQGTPLQSQTSATAQQAEQVPLGEGEPSEEAVLKLPMSEEVQAAINLARSEGGSAEGLREVLRSVFRHEDFRGQQLGIIQEVLQGQSTLAILPTGAGKSLCYQVPALVQEGTTLVVSPLVALMRDQLNHLPPQLPAAMLWRGQTKAQAMQVLSDLREGRLRILYVAPERLHNETLLNALAPLLPLPLLVVDEAHCVAEWGHNFRSAYFRLGHLIQERVPCNTVLALTATATKTTQQSIREVLRIPEESTIRESELPSNLRLAVQDVRAGLQGSLKPALLKIVKQAQKGTTTIVYTTFQSQADEIAGYLYVNGVSASSYHAGKLDQERERIQEEFCQAKLQVVVATVAFGMGLDAMHVRCIIHLSIPRSLEEYVQQVGRAGRSGEEGRCHLFLSNPDYLRLRSLSHSDGIDSCQVASLLEDVFCGDHTAHSLRKNRAPSQAGGRFGVLSTPQLVQRLDVKEEVIETILSYIEALGGVLKMLPPTSATVSVAFYADNPRKLADQHEIISVLLMVVPKPRQGTYHAPMAALCNLMLQPPYKIVKALQELAASDQLRFELARQQALAFEILERPADLHMLAVELAARHRRASQLQVGRIDTAFRTFDAVRKLETGQLQEVALRSSIRSYFEEQVTDGEACDVEDLEGLPLRPAQPMLGADCRALLLHIEKSGQVATNPARVAARILHGLSSPEYPAKAWSNCGFWARYSDVAFSVVLRIAQRQNRLPIEFLERGDQL